MQQPVRLVEICDIQMPWCVSQTLGCMAALFTPGSLVPAAAFDALGSNQPLAARCVDGGCGPNTMLHLRNRLPCCDVRDCNGEGFDMGKPRKRGRAAEAPP